jgi:hypothetical protein
MILFTSFREIFITYLQSAEGSRFQIENFQGKKSNDQNFEYICEFQNLLKTSCLLCTDSVDRSHFALTQWTRVSLNGDSAHGDSHFALTQCG